MLPKALELVGQRYCPVLVHGSIRVVFGVSQVNRKWYSKLSTADCYNAVSFLYEQGVVSHNYIIRVNVDLTTVTCYSIT